MFKFEDEQTIWEKMIFYSPKIKKKFYFPRK